MARSVLFVPGAFHGSWCFDVVVRQLRADDIDARSIDLPGREPGEPAGDLHSDADAVRLALDDFEEGVVLVGHAYSGAVVTEAGSHPSVQHLVFIAAFPLSQGESCMAAASDEADAAAISHEGRPDMGAGLSFDDQGLVWIKPDVARECFYDDCEPATADWAVERLGAQSAAALGQQALRFAWQNKPSTYVVCINDQATHPALQRILAKRCTEYVEWPSGHLPFLSQPALVVDLITRLAR